MKYPIYFGNETERFALGKPGSNPLFILGVNPSSANANNSDPTIRKVEGYLNKWCNLKEEENSAAQSLDGFVMMNLYPKRCAQPGNLPTQREDLVRHVNLEIICYFLAQHPAPIIWAAWGNSMGLRPYLLECLREIEAANRGAVWKKLSASFTLKDNPKHPNPQTHDYRERLTDFDVRFYLKDKAAQQVGKLGARKLA